MRTIFAAVAFFSLVGCTGSVEDGTSAAPPPTFPSTSDDAGTTATDGSTSRVDAAHDGASETTAHDSIAHDTMTGDSAGHDAGGDTLVAHDAIVVDGAPETMDDAGPSAARQVARPLGSTTAPNGFYEYLPPGYSPTGPGVPLMIFWHGLGEDGNGTTDLSKVLAHGPPMLIATDEWPASRPWIVLSPQNASGCPGADAIDAFITWAMKSYAVDVNRVYLTGLSCGAIGSWNYLGAHVDTSPVAAAVLISGDGRSAWSSKGCDLGRIAIWGFHGDADTTVAPAGTIETMTNLIACPEPPRKDAEMTIYPGVGHDAWTRTYDLSAGHDVYAWMLAHAK